MEAGTTPILTIDIIKEKIGEPEKYEVYFIEDEDLDNSYYHAFKFGGIKFFIAEYEDEEYYLRQSNGTQIICESLEELIEKIKYIVENQKLIT